MRRPFDFFDEWWKELEKLAGVPWEKPYLECAIEAHRIVAARFYQEDGE